MYKNSIPYIISIKNNISGEIATFKEAYAVSLAGPLKPDFRKRANQIFIENNMMKKWNVTIEDCDIQIIDGELFGY